MTNSESPLISTSSAPSLSKISSPAIMASYSASLIEQSLSSQNLSLVGIFSGKMIRIPTPVPFYGQNHRNRASKVAQVRNSGCSGHMTKQKLMLQTLKQKVGGTLGFGGK